MYLALTAAPVPTGILSHYMRPVNFAPKIVSKGININHSSKDKHLSSLYFNVTV